MPTSVLRRPGLAGVVLTGAALALVASDSSAAAASPVDGIPCDQAQHQAMHVHVHLAIYAGGVERTIPAGVGVVGATIRQTPEGPLVVAGLCFSWLHTHTADGIVHVEAPYQRWFTLGEFFDVWGRALSRGQVGDDRGAVTAYLDGGRFAGDPRRLPLVDRAVIQLDVGTDTPPRPYLFGFTPGSYLLAGAVTAGAVALTALATSWTWPARLLVTALAFVLVAAWRTACGLLGVDAAGPLGDAAVDAGSAIGGGLGAAAVAVSIGAGGASRWLPAAVGGAVGLAAGFVL